MNEFLKKALEERKRKEKEQIQNNKDTFFDSLEYCVLGEKGRVVRIIGMPAEIRKNPWDAKFILESQILRDDKKGYIKVRWPFEEKNGKIVPDSEWILTKLYNKVMEGYWSPYKDGRVNEKGKNGEWVKKHEHTQAYKRIMGNSKEGELFPKKFYPSLKVVMQVIDRHDDYCKNNKKLKILISKSTPYTFTDNSGIEKTIYYRETGIPKSAYDAIFEHFTQIGTFWEDTDAIIIRKAAQKTYVVWDKADRYLSEYEKNLASDLPLTEEEKKYEKYNLDEIYKPTSYSTLKKHLSGLFKLVDSELGTNFYEMLLVLIEKEAQEKDTNKEINNNLEEEIDDTPSLLINVNESNLFSNKPEKETTKINKIPKGPKFSDIELKSTFPYIDSLSDKEKEILINSIYHIENNVPTYHFSVEECYCVNINKKCCFVNSSIATSYPIELSVCPVCGSSYGKWKKISF